MTPGREGRVAVTMPQLGETVAEGTVLRWLKQVGDTVADQEPLLEISTDKVDAEVPSPAGGVLAEIVVGEDETVDVGTVLAHVSPGAGSTGLLAEAAGEPPVAPMAEERSPSPPSDERSSPATPAPSSPESDQPGDSADHPQASAGPRHRHSPRVRRLAHDGGVDLATLTGTGPGGRVTPGDVERATSAEESEALPGHAAPRPLPHQSRDSGVSDHRAFRTIVAEVDVPSTQWLSRSEAAPHPVPGPAAATMVAAVAGALRGHPSLVAPGADVAAGDLAVSWSTDSQTISSLLSQAADLNVGGVAQRLLAGAGTDVDTAGVGFTVSLLQDGDALFEVTAPPPGHVATIAFGPPTERVVVVHADGSPSIAIRPRSYVAMSHDPATVPKAQALAFLRDVVRRAGSRT